MTKSQVQLSHMYSKIKKNILSNAYNSIGSKINRKVVVFESDDWGAVRMRDQKAFIHLKANGIPVHRSLYDSLDSLERKSDLTLLLEVLGNYENSSGCSPVFTFNTVMGNPDFEAIKRDDFKNYHFRDLFQSYKHYYGEDNKSLWRGGMSQRLIRPQFHAREHLNVPLWMKDLKSGNKETRLAFDHGFYGLKTQTSSSLQKSYLASYRAETSDEFVQMCAIALEGLIRFKNTFGYSSRSFIAANYVWPKELESFLNRHGVHYIQTQRGHIAPVLNRNKVKVYRHYFGQKNKSGQRYLLRNVLFEPYLNQDKDWVDSTMKEISNAFFWEKPAIICSHRINYVSNMSVKHRDASLRKLNELLRRIIQKWPDVQFMSSDQLGDHCFKKS